jgi:hypothetical protein
MCIVTVLSALALLKYCASFEELHSLSDELSVKFAAFMGSYEPLKRLLAAELLSSGSLRFPNIGFGTLNSFLKAVLERIALISFKFFP